MKKILLSLFVITSFAAYSIYQRVSGHFELATTETDEKGSSATPASMVTTSSVSVLDSTAADLSAKPNPSPRFSNRHSLPLGDDDDENEQEDGENGENIEIAPGVKAVNSAPAPTPSLQTRSAPTTSTNAGRKTRPTSVPPTQTTTAPASQGQFKNGEYTGPVVDAYYGNVQVKAVIRSGKLTDVVFLDYPQDRNTSIKINTRAMPTLKSEAIQAQSGQVDGVSGATQTSIAFRESLSAALSQAKI